MDTTNQRQQPLQMPLSGQPTPPPPVSQIPEAKPTSQPPTLPNPLPNVSLPKTESYVKHLFHGRLTRRGYLLGYIIVNAVYLALGSFIAHILGLFPVDLSILIQLTFYILSPLFVLALLSLNARRLHDLSHTGWLSLLMLLPFVNFFFFLYLAIMKSKPQDNLYGTVPTKQTLQEILVIPHKS